MKRLLLVLLALAAPPAHAQFLDKTACYLSGTLTKCIKPVSPAGGGTGVANNAASTLTISGNFATTLTVTAITGITLPTTGTLATLAGSETLTNKTLTGNLAANLINSTGQINLNSSGTITVPNATATLAIASRLINTTAPITGGGDLSADRTIAISAATNAAAGSISREDASSSTLTVSGGCASTTPATAYYARSGSIATVYIDTLTCVSNATTQPSISAIPSQFRPARVVICPGVRVSDNNVDVTGMVRIATDGTMLVYNTIAGGSTFVASSVKGVDNMACSYPLN